MKKVTSLVLALMLAVTLIVPFATMEANAAFSVRTSMPEFDSSEGKAYYYTNNNVFYKYNYGPNRKYISGQGGYVVGNCTWYAYARASEIMGKNLNSAFRYSASQWWNINKSGNYYPYGSEPKVGAIACYSNHVAIVEKVENGKVYVSESGWKVSSKCPSSASDLRFHYGTPWNSNPKGYIYIIDSTTTSAKKVDYSVKITATDLNMRTGPGTGYSRIGFIKQGTYKVSQEYGNWAKLADSGYWICLTYATKVASATESVVSSGTSANYKVKVATDNLNMRTGPSTSYTRKGFIKPGTYTINMTNNGWGKVAETGYWICLKYTTAVSTTTSSSTSSSASSSTVTTAPSTTTTEAYKVKITASALHMRTGPSTSYSSKGLISRNSIHEIKATNNGWGQLKSNGYWIKLSYTEAVSGEYNVQVKATDLNMRTGPSTSYTRKGFITPGIHTICQTSNGWGKLKSNGYWIKLSYTTKM